MIVVGYLDNKKTRELERVREGQRGLGLGS